VIGGPRAPSKYEGQVTRLAILTGLPGIAVSLYLLWMNGATARVFWTAAVLLCGAWIVATMMLREKVVRPLQTLSNMLAALREGDYSIRARGAERDDALGLAFLESNLLGETLRAQRLGAMEATTLLRTVMAEIDVAIFAFDQDGRLRLVNRAGERLLDQPAERLLGRTPAQAGLDPYVEGDSVRTIDATFPGASGRWEVRRGSFRQDGIPHLLPISCW
jgi:two-component system, NtrC family, nitrogen regulation sensor histidine kinase NtrY